MSSSDSALSGGNAPRELCHEWRKCLVARAALNACANTDKQLPNCNIDAAKDSVSRSFRGDSVESSGGIDFVASSRSKDPERYVLKTN